VEIPWLSLFGVALLTSCRAKRTPSRRVEAVLSGARAVTLAEAVAEGEQPQGLARRPGWGP
jgi:hypothetical protein